MLFGSEFGFGGRDCCDWHFSSLDDPRVRGFVVKTHVSVITYVLFAPSLSMAEMHALFAVGPPCTCSAVNGRFRVSVFPPFRSTDIPIPSMGPGVLA